MTILGRQFPTGDDADGLVLATDDGTELEDVTVVDEGTITATMPAQDPGAVVGLVLTLPTGPSAELASAFTYDEA